MTSVPLPTVQKELYFSNPGKKFATPYQQFFGVPWRGQEIASRRLNRNQFLGYGRARTDQKNWLEEPGTGMLLAGESGRPAKVKHNDVKPLHCSHRYTFRRRLDAK